MDLITAAKSGNFELAFNLLQSGCSTTICDKDHATPLYWSACHGHTNICGILIQAGSDVNTRVTWGSTPLHAAADRGHKSCIEVLIESGATVNARNNRGDTALHIAAYRGHVDIIMTLLRAKADVTMRNEKGKTPQQEALEGGHHQIAENIMNFSNVVGMQSASPMPLQVNGYTTPNPRTPEVRLNGYMRQASEVSDDDQVIRDYENSPQRRAGHRSVMRLNSVDTPPPRPPVALSRSISFSGNHNRQTNGHVNLGGRILENQIEPRTYSLGSIPGYDVTKCMNDVNRGFSSAEFVNEMPMCISQNDSLSQTSSYLSSSAYSSDASWNNPSLMTSGSENEPVESSEYPTPTSHDVPHIPPRLHVPSSRPNRSSIGSLREICQNGTAVPEPENAQGFVMTLKKQLVESYKNVEKLSTDNESLKFKCTTLLHRLSETEQNCSDKSRECETLRQMLDAKTRELAEMKHKMMNRHEESTSEVNAIDKHGFKQFSEHLIKELSEDAVTEVQDILRESLQNHALCREEGDIDVIDAPHREWVPGVDYVILGRQPINTQLDGHVNAFPQSLSFLVKHLKTGRKLHLKLMLRKRKRSLLEPDDSEIDILEKIGPHKNIVKILHSYEGSIERFKRFIPVPFSKTDSIDDLSCRTTFIVTEQMTPLASFVNSYAELKSRGLTSVFLTHALYQLLSVLSMLDELNITHNHINEDSLFVDSEFQPVLANFEYANCLDEKPSMSNGDRYPLEPDDDLREYVNVTHLARGSQPVCMSQESRAKLTDLTNLCKVFDNMLMSETPAPRYNTDDTLTDDTLSIPPDIWRIINGIITSTHSQCLCSRDCLQRMGFCLFGPKHDEVKSQFECRTFMQTNMLHLLSFKPNEQRNAVVDHETSVRRAIYRSKFEIEAHFLCNTSPKQIWDMQRTLKKL